jgi:hypothetical protein
MVKYILILANALIVLIFGWFSSDNGVSVSGNFPKTMKPGTEVPVELTVKKGSLGGFAKLQLELPEGISVKESDNKGASFTATPGLAKWIWTSLPSEAEMMVKFILVADASANGAKTVGGKFSFVENNAKQVSEMTPVEIIISNEGESTSTANTSSSSNNSSNSAPVADNTSATSTPTNNSGDKNSSGTAAEPKTSPNGEPVGNVSATRLVTVLNPNEFQIDVKIKKDGTKGFARYSDNLPEGFTARQGKTDGSSFSVSDGKIKFVWVTVPAAEELNISYILKGSDTKATTLSGEYSYLEDNQSKKVKVADASLAATSGAIATNSETTAANNTNATASNSGIKENKNESGTQGNTDTKSNSATNEASTSKESSTTKTNSGNNTTSGTTGDVANTSKTEKEPGSTSDKNSGSGAVKNTDGSGTSTNKTETTLNDNINKKEGNVNYAVQVGAFTNAGVTANLLSSKFGIKEKIRSEMASGFTKFMVGNHNEYKSARDHRETVKTNNGVNSAFVVAYNGGRRITVQEALTITNQKWFK